MAATRVEPKPKPPLEKGARPDKNANHKIEPEAKAMNGVVEAAPAAPVAEKTWEGLTAAQLVAYYRAMYISRKVDDREILLKRQQKVFFQISGAGHECISVAAAMALRSGHDWFYPYYRDRALVLALGQSPYEMLMGSVGAADDPNSGGRQMPSHWTDNRLNIPSQSSPTGTQVLQAVGCAEAGRYYASHPDAAKKVDGDYRQCKDVKFHNDEIVYVSLGDGSTSEGEFWEAMNTISNQRLPMIVVVQDNHYAISTPVEVQTPGGNISRIVANFPGFLFDEIDGTNALECYASMVKAEKYVRSRRGPAFIHAHVIRPYSHSLSDDERLYRSAAELQEDARRDPITRMQLFLIREGILDERGLTQLERQVDNEVQEAADRALESRFPKPDSVMDFIYSPHVDPTSAQFETQPLTAGAPKTMADLINATLHDEMKRDERIVVFGEDVADCSRDEYLKQKQVKGKGGVFKLTSGLQMAYGNDRVFNSPLAEANIVGRAIGMSTRGLKPVAEIQFFDYIWPAMLQIRDEWSVLRWRSNNGTSAPFVLRVPIGGYLTGGAIYHSQCGESIFTHIPGLRVIFPCNALDAAGLLRTAIRCDDPVLFLEHKRLYRETYGRAPYPGPDYMIPFGKAKIVQEGSDLTVVTYGALVPRALQAAQKLERDHGIKAEIIDLRSLSPYDWDAIATSVRKTNRVIVAHEDVLSFGYGAEIAARIADELFEDLDAPVRRIAAKDVFVAYYPPLEDVILPQPDDVYREMKRLAEW